MSTDVIISRTVQILEFLVSQSPDTVGVRELARALSLSPSSVHRVMQAVMQTGLVHQQDGRYSLGMDFYRLAWIATSRYPVRELALPVMERLVQQCSETALLTIYDPQRGQMSFLVSVESPQPIRYVVNLNEWVPLHAGASGLAILSFLPESERRHISELHGLPALTDHTITDIAGLDAEMARIRTAGYAVSQGQRIPGASCVASPVRGPDGRVTGSLMVTLPQYRFGPDSESYLASLVMAHANELSAALGYRSATNMLRSSKQ